MPVSIVLENSKWTLNLAESCDWIELKKKNYSFRYFRLGNLLCTLQAKISYIHNYIEKMSKLNTFYCMPYKMVTKLWTSQGYWLAEIMQDINLVYKFNSIKFILTTYNISVTPLNMKCVWYAEVHAHWYFSCAGKLNWKTFCRHQMSRFLGAPNLKDKRLRIHGGIIGERIKKKLGRNEQQNY